MPMMSQMIQQEPKVRVWLLTVEIGILWRHIYETNLCHWSWQQGIHLVLITIQRLVRSVRQGCAAVNNANGRLSRYSFCDFRNLGYWCLRCCRCRKCASNAFLFVSIALINNHMSWSKIIEWKICNRLEKIHINVKRTFLFWVNIILYYSS